MCFIGKEQVNIPSEDERPQRTAAREAAGLYCESMLLDRVEGSERQIRRVLGQQHYFYVGLLIGLVQAQQPFDHLEARALADSSILPFELQLRIGPHAFVHETGVLFLKVE
jgi:hypothetical protein